MHESFTISNMTPQDFKGAIVVRSQSWEDTYVNEAEGVSRDWIQERNKKQLFPERIEKYKKLIENGDVVGFVAKDASGKIIGMATPFIDKEGMQRLGSLYVDQSWHGKGVGGVLMQKIIEWSDPKKPIRLGVVAYNDRAIAFYRKWGFEEIPGSETLFDNKIPEIMMTRKGDKQ